MADNEAIARKARSEALLAAAGARINPHLPIIERAAEADMRTAREAADRLLALTLVAVRGEGEDQIAADEIARRNVRPLLTALERVFVDDAAPSSHERVQFSWRYEAAWTLFWALGWLGEEGLGLPREICDVPLLAGTVGRTDDLAAHGLKPASELLDATDLIYRCHWATRQARLEGVEPTGGLEPGVTMERHHALNWLTGYMDCAEWDEVGTDT